MGRLTDIHIRALVKAKKPVAGFSDGGGLTFTLSSNGTAAWVLRYRFGGRQKELTLGRYPDTSLKRARELATKDRARVIEGVDVAREKQQTKEAHRTAGTVRELCDEFMERVVTRERKRPELAQRIINKDILPVIGKQPARDVTDRQIINLLDRIVDRGARAQANHTLRLLKQIFRYGVSRRYLDRSPCTEIGTDAAGGRERTRNRSLSQEELTKFLSALNRADIHEASRFSFKIILATCVRVGELVNARWENIDLQQRVWHIPAQDTKTGEAIDIPLVPQVVEWFERLKGLAGDSPYVLPTRRSKVRPNLDTQSLRVALRKVDAGIEHFVTHDLRRTARTHLAVLGVSREVAERCLNHRLEGVERIYNQYDYFDERREALMQYTNMLETLEQGEDFNVVTIKKGA